MILDQCRSQIVRLETAIDDLNALNVDGRAEMAVELCTRELTKELETARHERQT